MSVTELLKHVKALTPRERKKLLRDIEAMDSRAPNAREATNRRVQWPDVAARAARVTGGRILPNVVILEREESAY